MMKNWDDVETNLETARNSDGTIDEQAEIYADSWEAARNRTKAALEELYSDIIDPNFFKELEKVFAGLAQTVDGLIKGMGGIPGILATVSGTIMSTFAKKAPDALNNFKQNLMVTFGVAQKEALKTQQQLGNYLKNNTFDEEIQAEVEGKQKVAQLEQFLAQNEKTLTEASKKAIQGRIKIVEALTEAYAKMSTTARESAKANKEFIEETKKNVRDEFYESGLVSQTNSLNRVINKNTNGSASMITNRLTSVFGKDLEENDNFQTLLDLLDYNGKIDKDGSLTKQEEQAIAAGVKDYRITDSSYARILRDSAMFKDNQVSPINIQSEFNTFLKDYLNKVEQNASATSLKDYFRGQQKSYKQDNTSVKDQLNSYTQMFAKTKELDILKTENLKSILDNSIEDLGKIDITKDAISVQNDINNILNRFLETLENALDENKVLGDEEPELILASEKGLKADKILSSFGYSKEDLTTEINKRQSQVVTDNFNVITQKEKIDNIANNVQEDILPKSASQKFFEFSGAVTTALGSVQAFQSGISTLGQVMEGELDPMQSLGAVIGMVGSSMGSISSITKLSQSNFFSFTKSIQAGQSSFLGLTGSMGSFVATALPIAAIIGGITAAFYIFKTIADAVYANSPEGKLDKATEASKALDESLNSAKESAEDLQSAFDNYNSIVDNLKSLTVGTSEWKDAMSEARLEALNLIQAYDGLELNEDGLITEESMKKAQEEAEERVRAATYASTLGKQNVRDARINLQAKQIGDRINSKNSDKYVSLSEGREAREALQELIAVNGNLEELDSVTRQNLESTVDKEDIDEVIENIKTNTETTKAENKTLAKTIVESNSKISNSKYADEIAERAGDILEARTDEAQARLEAEGWGKEGISQLTKTNAEAERVFEEFREAANLSDKVKLTDTTGNDDDRKFVYDDENGESQTVTLEYMRTVVAAAEASKQVSEASENLLKAINKIDDNDVALKELLLNGNIDNVTKEQLEALGVNSVEELEAKIDKLIGDGDGSLSDDEAKSINYDKNTSSEFIDNQENFDKYIQENLKSQMDIFNRAYETELQSLDIQTLGAAKNLRETLEKAFSQGGKGLSDSILEPLKDLKGTELDEAINAISDSLGESIDTVYANIDALDLEEDAKKQLIAIITELNSTTVDATEQFQKLSTVLDSINGDDNSITTDEYEALTDNLKTFFTLAADGTYKLKTNALEFYQITKETMQKGFLEQMANYSAIVSNYASGDEILSSNDNNAKNALLEQSEEENLQELLAIGNNKGATAEELEKYNEAVANNIDKFDSIGIELEEIRSQYASTASSLSELKEMRSVIGDAAYNEQAAVLDSAEDMKGLDVEEVQTYAKTLKESAKYVEGWSDTMSDFDAQNVAKDIMKMNSAIETLNENFVAGEDDTDSWVSIIAQSSVTSKEYSDAMTGTKDALAQLMNVSAEYITDDFVRTHLVEISEAATGSAEAIDNLKAAMLDVTIGQIVDENDIANVDEFTNSIYDMVNQINQMQIGDSLSDSFISQLNAMIEAGQLTYDQVMNLLGNMNVNASVVLNDNEIKYKTPVTETKHTRTITGWDQYNNPTEWTDKEQIVNQGMSEMTGSFPSFAMATSAGAEAVETPKIQVTKGTVSASGSANNWSSSNAGGQSSPSKSSSKSSDSSKQKEIKDRQESELDVYHDVNAAIERVSDSLDKLDKKKSHYYGSQLISALTEENRLLQEQANNYQWLGKVINSELGRLQGDLSRYGVSFDSTTGKILNYTEAYNNALATYNNAISAYNASEQSNADKTALENAKDTYDRFKKYIEEYDNTLEKQMKNENDILENTYTQIENNFSAWETKIQITIDLSAAKQEWTKFWQKVNKDIRNSLEDYPKEIANATTNYNLKNNDVATYLKKVEDIKREIDLFQANRNNPNYTTDMFVSESEAANALLEAEEELRSAAESVFDEYETAWNSYLEQIDDVIDKWDDVLDEFDKINDKLDHYTKVIELLYKDGDAAKLLNSQIYDSNNQTNLARLNMLREQNAAFTKQREELLAAGAKETDEDVQKLTDAIEENGDQMRSAIEQYLEGLSDQFANSISIAMSDMDKQISGNPQGMDFIIQRWEDAQKKAEDYYDDVERIYELDKLNSDWQNLVDSSSSVKTQQKLRDLQEAQLEKLKEKTKLSKYDIELAEKQLAVAQAQAALDDAQNAKNSMKLVRNEQGNWAYQYVADEDDVAAKEQDLLAKTHEWYEFTKTSYEEGVENLMSLQQEAQERLTALMEELNTADEERRLQLQEEYDYLYDYYYGEEGLIVTKSRETEEMKQELNNATFNDLQVLYQIDEENYKIMTDNEKDLINSLRDNGIDAYKALMEAVVGEDKHSGYYGDILAGCQDVNEQSLESWKTLAAGVVSRWATDTDSVRNIVASTYLTCANCQSYFDNMVAQGTYASGVNFANLSSYIGGTATQLQNAINKTSELISATNGINTSASIVYGLATNWSAVATSISQANGELNRYLSILGGSGDIGYAYTQYAPNGVADTIYAKVAQPESDSSSNSSNWNGSNASSLKSETSGSDTTNLSNTSSSNNALSTIASIFNGGIAISTALATGSSKITDTSQITGSDIQNYYELIYKRKNNTSTSSSSTSSKRFVIDPIDSLHPAQSAQGGYTGTWGANEGAFGTNGKLAVLHQNETILSQKQSDILFNGLEVLSSLGEMVSSMLNFGDKQINSMLGKVTNNQESSNNVFNISAEFPNAENVNEIREAIMGLPNLASQYLN